MKDILNNISYGLFFILVITVIVFYMIQHDKLYYKNLKDPFDGDINY